MVTCRSLPRGNDLHIDVICIELLTVLRATLQNQLKWRLSFHQMLKAII